MRKTFSGVLALALCGVIAAFSFAGCHTKRIEIDANISDENESNITWELSETGTLTLSGNGPMKDYEYDSEEDWLGQKDCIKKVIIGDGITSIGSYAFYDCNDLKSVMFPDSLEIIGNSAFYGCNDLKNVILPDSLEIIGDDAFAVCGLEEIDIPANVSKIGQTAFF